MYSAELHKLFIILFRYMDKDFILMLLALKNWKSVFSRYSLLILLFIKLVLIFDKIRKNMTALISLDIDHKNAKQ